RPPRSGMPTFVSLPEVIKDAAVNEFPGQGAGFLGKVWDPIRIEGEPGRVGFRLPDLDLPPDVDARRLEERRLLRQGLDRTLAEQDRRPVFHDLDGVYRQAYQLIRSPAVRRALELDREPQRMRDAYGSHLFGQGCLL